jgi:hypothetical protein
MRGVTMEILVSVVFKLLLFCMVCPQNKTLCCKSSRKEDSGGVDLLFITSCYFFLFFLAQQPPWTKSSSFRSDLDDTQRRSRVGRTLLDQ